VDGKRHEGEAGEVESELEVLRLRREKGEGQKESFEVCVYGRLSTEEAEEE
jgi:hypothetical protein